MAYILLVDDEPEGVMLASGYLTGRGHRTEVVNDGRTAIARIRGGVPDILVTDIMLPFADGLMVIQELETLYPRGRVGIIVLTHVAADGEPLRDWTESTVDGYVLRHANAQVLAWQVVLAVEGCLHRLGRPLRERPLAQKQSGGQP
jgi:CheY-like chemotaxis protein